MEYVRTKDGKIFSFYEIAKYDLSNSFVVIGFADEKDKFLLNGGTYIKGDKVFAISNKIEELCDTFIAIAGNGVICAYQTLQELKHYECIGSTELPCSPFVEKYGAIHIKNKGLIYVAKMNDKGELELL